MNKALIFAVVAFALVAAIGKFALHQRMRTVAIEAVGAAVVVGAGTYVGTRGKA